MQAEEKGARVVKVKYGNEIRCFGLKEVSEIVTIEGKTVTTDSFGNFTVFLIDTEGKKVLPILIGPFEAQAIALQLQANIRQDP